MFSPTEASQGNSAAYNAYLTRRQTPQRYLILPGIDTASLLGQTLLSTFYDAVTAELPPSKEEGRLLGWPCVADKWGRFLNLAGTPHSPRGVPPFSAAGARTQLAKAGGRVPQEHLDTKARARAERLAKQFIGDGGTPVIYLQRGVSQGIPSMSKSTMDAWTTVRKWLDNWEHIGKLLRRGDLTTLAARYDIVNAFYVAYRMQNDNAKVIDGRTVGKDRVVMDWTGKWMVADRRLPKSVPESEFRSRFICCRSRKLNASGLAFTFPLRIVFARNQVYWDRYHEYVKYNPSGPAVVEKMSRFRAIGLFDFDNHDVYIPSELRDVLIDREGELFGPFWRDMCEWTYRAPQIIKADYDGMANPRMDGDVFRMDTWTGNYVNPSGHPGTDKLATFAGVFDWYDAACEAGLIGESEQELEDYLHGRSSVAALVQGDNCALMASDDRTIDHWVEAQRFGVTSSTHSFLGNIFYRDHRGWASLPDLTSALLGFWTPMRPIDAPLRGDWATGWIERQKVFAGHPLYGKLRDIEAEVSKQVLSLDIEEYARKEANRPTDTRDVVSLVDAEFMLNPDIIHYKYGVASLSEKLREKNFLAVDPSHYLTMFKGLGGM